MIVRTRPDGTTVAIRQHDHALISGQLADAWALGRRPGPVARFAIAYHDVAWVGLDLVVRRHGASGEPATFLDHPLEPKYAAYRAGVDLVETASPYAGWLCSSHYARFASQLDDERSRRYLDHERSRQERLWPHLDDDERRHAHWDLELLRLCDGLSLFLCLNEPGENRWPWYRDGFDFAGTHLTPSWRSPGWLRFEPDPFAAPVTVHLPLHPLRPGAEELAEPEVLTIRVGG